MNNKKRIALFFFVLLALPLQALQIDPEVLHFQSMPDETLKGSFKITNDEATTVNFSLTVSDWKYDATGQVLMVPSQGNQNSLKNWLTLDLSPVTLGPGQSLDLPVQIKVPESVFGSHAAGILIQDGKLHWALLVHSILGSVEKIDFENLKYQVKPRSIQLSYKLTNAGEVFTGASGYVAVISETGLVLGKMKLEPVSFFPGETRIIQTVLPLDLALADGQNYLRFVFQSEGESTPLLKIEKPLLRDQTVVPTKIMEVVPVATVPSKVVKWALQKATFQMSDARTLKGFLQIANQEDQPLTPTGLINVFNAKNRQVFAGKIPSRTILAGYSDLVTAKWTLGQSLKPGIYTVKVKLLYQNAALESQAQFTVK